MTVVCLGVSACVLAAATVTHAATPLTLPFRDSSISATDVSLPVPPPPPVARRDVGPLRVVIKPVLDCASNGTAPKPCARASTGNRQPATGNRS